MAHFELTLIDSRDNGCHEDLIVRVGSRTFVCDSYYLLIDRTEEGEDRAKARRVLARLLDQWIHVVESMSDAETVFLPFDFSDQHTTLLRIERRGAHVTITAGWSTIEGWSFLPSNISSVVRAVSDWRQDSESQSMAMVAFLEDLRFIRDRETQ